MRTLFLALIYSVIMRNFLRIVIGVKFRNKEVLTANPQYIIVANHNSHLDTMAIMSSIPFSMLSKVRPVAAGDYFGKSKGKAFFTKLFVNALLIPRKRSEGSKDPVQMMLYQISKGNSLLIFPEGSRGEPEKLQKFKKGVGLVLEQYPQIPYIPVFMQGLGKILPKGDGVLVPFDSYVIFGEPQMVKSKNADEIVAEVEATILSLQEKLPASSKTSKV